jgi:hypothetical protein
MTKAPLALLRRLLDETGYRVLFRTSGWAECFVHRDVERWEGRGRTEDEALADALAKMLPSHLAEDVLRRVVSAGEPQSFQSGGGAEGKTAALSTPIAAPLTDGGVPVVRADLETSSQLPAASALERGRDHVEDVPAPPAPIVHAPLASEALPFRASVADHAALDPPALAPETLASEALASVAPGTPDPSSSSVVLVAEASKPAPSRPSADAPVERVERVERVESFSSGRSQLAAVAKLRPADALDAVERQLAGIEDRLGALARMSGERQRLHMMVWICRARSIEEALPGLRDVEQAVARVARRLTEIGKMFWPGSVRALQLSARPADVRRELHASWASDPANWRDATALAERLLDEHLAKSTEAGLDDDGWADLASCTPRPADPDALLQEVDGIIKGLLVPPGEVPNGRAGDLPSADLDRLVTSARKLRWVRGAVHDDVAWGVAVGRLRRALPSLGERGARVRDTLDNRTKPSAPWAKILGEAPAEPKSAPGESPEELRAALPAASVTKEGLLAWLIRAFDVLNTPELVALLVPLKGELDAFDEDTLNHSDRRVRRRLRELVKRVAAAAEAPPETPREDAKQKEAAREAEEAAAEDSTASHALDALAARVRQETEGRRVLFVSNREDPDLGARLTELLGIEITWCDGSLRRVQAQCERIKGGSYNLVLSATGFQVHGVDAALSRAASAASVPYVRVNRGRPVACVQAIAREFGLYSGTYKVESPRASSGEDD